MNSPSSQLISRADWSAGIIKAVNSTRSIPLTAEQEGDALALIRGAWANRFLAVKFANRRPLPVLREIERSLPTLKKAKNLIEKQLLELNQDGEKELSGAATDAVAGALFRSDTEKDLALFFDHDRGFPKYARAVDDTVFVLNAMIGHFEDVLARNHHEPPGIRGNPSRAYVADLLVAWADINEIDVGAVEIGEAKTFEANPFLRFAAAVEQRVEGLCPGFEKAGGQLLSLETIATYATKSRNRARS